MPETSERLSAWQAAFELAFEQRLADREETPSRLMGAMRYSALAGGKRMRPMLVYGAARAIGVPRSDMDGVACAIEAIHAYSLIHDDLPAMDDDDLRRGRATLHRAYDEATAILAGDALQAKAFEILATDEALSRHPVAQCQLIAEIAKACGAAGMAGGQMLDLAAIDRDISYADLEVMHRLKTGALISVACTAPAVFATVSAQVRGKLERFGNLVGLAFQIHDDILDVTGSAATTGKAVHGDAARNKPTFPSLIGLESSRDRARELISLAEAQLTDLTGDTTVLAWLARYVIDRRR